MEERFKLTGEYIELIKLLKITGVCDTGGMAKMVVESESVMVDNVVETRKRCKIRKGQNVRFQDIFIWVD